MKTAVVLASVTLLFALPAFAQTPAPPSSAPQNAQMPAPKAEPAVDTFMKIDANADGSLSLEEIRVVDSKVVVADFDKYDADKTKTLTRAEFGKWTADRKAAKEPASGG